MPLLKPKRQGKASVHEVESHNIKEMLHSFKRTGKIGNTRPKNMAHAQQIAVAAAKTNTRSSQSKQSKKSAG